MARLRQVDTSKAFKDDLITVKNTTTHSHGPAGEHAHAGTAFTTWLDFHQAILQAEAILKALQARQPRDSEFFAGNFAGLKQDLQALDAAMLSLSENTPVRQFMASHPVCQYLARRYRLDLGVMTWEPDEFPGQDQWQLFSQLLRQQPARGMVWEAEPVPENEQKLTGTGVSVVVFAPCMNVPQVGDFLSVMQQNVQNLENLVETATGSEPRRHK